MGDLEGDATPGQAEASLWSDLLSRLRRPGTTRTLVSFYGIVVAGFGVDAVVRLVIDPYTVRRLGVSSAGSFLMAFGIVEFLCFLSHGGWSNAVLKVHRDYQPPEKAQLFSTFFWLTSLTAAALGVALLLGAGPIGRVYGDPGLRRFLVIMAPAVLLWTVGQTATVTLNARFQISRLTAFNALESTCKLSIIPLSCVLGPMGVPAGYLAAFGVGALVRQTYLQLSAYRLRLPQLRYASDLARHAFYLLGASVSLELIKLINRYFVGYWHEPAEVTILYVALSLAALSTIPCRLYHRVMISFVSQKKSWSSFSPRSLRLFLLASVVAGLVILVIALLAGPLVIKLLYGADIANRARASYYVAVVGAFFFNLYFMLLSFIIKFSQAYKLTVLLASALAVNVFLNFALVPARGAFGGASAAAVSSAVLGVGLAVVYLREGLGAAHRGGGNASEGELP